MSIVLKYSAKEYSAKEYSAKEYSAKEYSAEETCSALLENIIRTGGSDEILSVYRNIIRHRSNLPIVFNTIRANIDWLSRETICQLIIITANIGSSDLLREILLSLRGRLAGAYEEYIFVYIDKYTPMIDTRVYLERFDILWNTYVGFHPVQSKRFVYVLKHIIKKLQLYSLVTYNLEINFIIARIIVEHITTALLDDYTRVLLFRIACYDDSFGFFKYLKDLNCQISELSVRYRECIIEEFRRGLKLLPRLIKIVNYLFDESIEPSELHLFYTWAHSRQSHNIEILYYLIDIDVRIPIKRKSFFELIYGRNSPYNPHDMIMILLQDMFDES